MQKAKSRYSYAGTQRSPSMRARMQPLRSGRLTHAQKDDFCASKKMKQAEGSMIKCPKGAL